MKKTRDSGEIVGIYPDMDGPDVVVRFGQVFIGPITIGRETLEAAGISVEIGSKLSALVDIDADEELNVEPDQIEPYTPPQFPSYRTSNFGLTAKNHLGR